MQLIFVAGPWGSGTTALTGALDKLGVPAFGPFLRTSDPRTRNSYELIPFRQVIWEYVDEPTISLKANCSEKLVAALSDFKNRLQEGEFGSWPPHEPKRLVLKMPLASICLSQITAVFDTTIILMHRPLHEIEASRRRRHWKTYYGQAGASVIYSRALSDIIRLRRSCLAISYSDLTGDTRRTMRRVINYCELQDLAGQIDQAVEVVRKPD